MSFPLPLTLETECNTLQDRTELSSYVMARHRQHRYLVLRTKSEKEKCGLPCGVVDAYQAKFVGLDHANLATAARPFRDHRPGLQ